MKLESLSKMSSKRDMSFIFRELINKKTDLSCSTKKVSKSTKYYGLFRFVSVQMTSIFVAELINTTSGVDEFHLTCEERVRCIGDF